MTAELGMNLAGVERVFELEDQLERMAARMKSLEQRAEAMRMEMEAELEGVRKSFRAEIVPYDPTGGRILPAGEQRFRIPVSRPGRRDDAASLKIPGAVRSLCAICACVLACQLGPGAGSAPRGTAGVRHATFAHRPRPSPAMA